MKLATVTKMLLKKEEFWKSILFRRLFTFWYQHWDAVDVAPFLYLLNLSELLNIFVCFYSNSSVPDTLNGTGPGQDRDRTGT